MWDVLPIHAPDAYFWCQSPTSNKNGSGCILQFTFATKRNTYFIPPLKGDKMKYFIHQRQGEASPRQYFMELGLDHEIRAPLDQYASNHETGLDNSAHTIHNYIFICYTWITHDKGPQLMYVILVNVQNK